MRRQLLRHPRVPPRRSPSVMRLHRWRPRRKAKPELTVAPSLLARQKNLDDVRHLPGPRTRPNNGPFTGELPSRFAAFASWIACTVRCAVSRRATPRSPYSPQIGHSVVIIILYVLTLGCKPLDDNWENIAFAATILPALHIPPMRILYVTILSGNLFSSIC